MASRNARTIDDNVAYGRACLRDSLMRGEAPMASHLLYTQAGVLDDSNPAERRFGIHAGHAWLRRADAVVVYMDHDISPGMQEGIDSANLMFNIPVEYRSIGEVSK